MRGLLSFYGSTPSYRPVLDVEGWGDVQPELNAMSKRGEWAEMAELITDEMVETLAVRGRPDETAPRSWCAASARPPTGCACTSRAIP